MTSTEVVRLPMTMAFDALDITFDHRVLRPRPWTVAQSRWAEELQRAAPEGPVLELCTGAGHIGLLSVLSTGRRLVAVDADPVACAFAAENADAAGIADRVEVRHAPLDRALEPGEQFPVVIADPPWVTSAHTGDFPEDPLFAIDGGPDGLELARGCVRVTDEHLAPEGAALLQLGSSEQATVLEDWITEAGLDLVVAEVRQPDPTGVLVLLRRPAGGVSRRTP